MNPDEKPGSTRRDAPCHIRTVQDSKGRAATEIFLFSFFFFKKKLEGAFELNGNFRLNVTF